MASPLRILVADPDPETARVAAEALPPPRFEIHGMADGREVLERAPGLKPDLMILEFSLPGASGVTVVKSLRARPEFALIPVIFLAERTAVETRILGFRIGADDFLRKPLDPGELDLRVALALKMRERTEVSFRPPSRRGADWSVVMSGLRGSLDQIGLPSLLGLIEAERKSGILVLMLDRDQDKARLWIEEGRVLKAQRDGREQPRNAELVYELLNLTQGKFDFRPCAVVLKDEVRIPTTHLLIEGARRIDETIRRTRPGE